MRLLLRDGTRSSPSLRGGARLDSRPRSPDRYLEGDQRVSASNCPGCLYSRVGYFVGRAGIRYLFWPATAIYADDGW